MMRVKGYGLCIHVHTNEIYLPKLLCTVMIVSEFYDTMPSGQIVEYIMRAFVDNTKA